MRILRALRLLRVFRKVGDLNKIIIAVSMSILPAFQALVRILSMSILPAFQALVRIHWHPFTCET
jgi:hypothetical protein